LNPSCKDGWWVENNAVHIHTSRGGILSSPANHNEGCPRVIQAGSIIAAGDLVAWGFIPGKKMQPGVSAGGTIYIHPATSLPAFTIARPIDALDL